jgi:hypothetical protein
MTALVIPPMIVARSQWDRMPSSLRRAICVLVPRESVVGNTLMVTVGRLRGLGAPSEADLLLAWFCPWLVPCRRLPHSAPLRHLLRVPGFRLTPVQWALARRVRDGWTLAQIARASGASPSTVLRWAQGRPVRSPSGESGLASGPGL